MHIHRSPCVSTWTASNDVQKSGRLADFRSIEKKRWCGRDQVYAVVLLMPSTSLVVVLHVPASIDSIGNNRPVGSHYLSDKHDFDVVLHRNKLRVVHSRFPGELLSLHRNVHLHRLETQLWLVFQRLRSLASLVNDAVLFWLDATLGACFPSVRKNGPGCHGQ